MNITFPFLYVLLIAIYNSLILLLCSTNKIETLNIHYMTVPLKYYHSMLAYRSDGWDAARRPCS